MTITEAEARERLNSAINFTETANMDTTPEQLLDDYRDAILQAGAERIRRAPHDGTGDNWGWWDAAEIPDHCANLIDPGKQEQR